MDGRYVFDVIYTDADTIIDTRKTLSFQSHITPQIQPMLNKG